MYFQLPSVLLTGKVTSLVGKPRLAEAVGVLDLIVF